MALQSKDKKQLVGTWEINIPKLNSTLRKENTTEEEIIKAAENRFPRFSRKTLKFKTTYIF